MSRLVKASVLIFVLVASLLVVQRWRGGHLYKRMPSPDGHAVAELRGSGAAGATDSEYLSVKLRSGYLAIPTEVFGATTYGGSVDARWNGPHLLVISLKHSSDLQIYRKDSLWNGVRVEYEEQN